MSTTDLKTIRTRPNLYTWGTVIKIHDIGEHYTLVESTELFQGGVERRFHVYVDSVDTNLCSSSFDRALLFAISQKTLGLNDEATSMAVAAMRIFEIDIKI
jgi:hypothetical protein